jgi:acyl carrier protein
MTLAERIQEVMDLIDMAFNSDAAMLPDSDLRSIGFDSLDTIELLLLLEERFPEAKLEDYEPTAETTIRQIAEEIERRLAA